MAGNDIGVTFIPSEQNQMAQGPKQGTAEGELGGARSSDLGTVFKILNLQLPRVVSPTAPTSSALLKAPGSAGLPGAPPAPSGMPGALSATMDPMAAVFAALLRAMQFGSAAPVGGGAPGGGSATGAPGGGVDLGGIGAPKITLGRKGPGDSTSLAPSPSAPTVPSAPSAALDVESSAPPQQDYQSWAGSY